MVAGPAGAFLCAKCVEISAALLGGSAERCQVPIPETQAPEPPRPHATRKESFIEAAVVLSKALGWSLAELRVLSPEDLRRALEKLEELDDG